MKKNKITEDGKDFKKIEKTCHYEAFLTLLRARSPCESIRVSHNNARGS